MGVANGETKSNNTFLITGQSGSKKYTTLSDEQFAVLYKWDRMADIGVFISMLPLFRRRLSAEGAKPESNNRWKSELGHVGG